MVLGLLCTEPQLLNTLELLYRRLWSSRCGTTAYHTSNKSEDLEWLLVELEEYIIEE